MATKKTAAKLSAAASHEPPEPARQFVDLGLTYPFGSDQTIAELVRCPKCGHEISPLEQKKPA